uniref:Uncharacterized protein n=1 Tax=Candidatus Kentrum sp. LPFa TaxID=2126335 RepID=A0A450WWI5_9GAMM|nr:MAG: hypothetical protein BECKLPF1236A_GA0070988_102977 [Candidatus Kentron sp. LPFa]VFK34625.1 MAG: hypothetical protein BECKLPF1236C_GA0070990_102866 [Candidatus Kentron sp. LPFa]
MEKPKIFVGSANESLHIVNGIVESLSKSEVIPVQWNVGALEATETIFQNLLDII